MTYTKNKEGIYLFDEGHEKKLVKKMTKAFMDAGVIENDSAENYLSNELSPLGPNELKVIYAPLAGLRHVQAQAYGEGAVSVRYEKIDQFGEANWVAPDAESLPASSISREEVENRVDRFGLYWHLTDDEISGDFVAQAKVAKYRRENAINGMMRWHDIALALGSTKKKFKGLANLPASKVTPQTLTTAIASVNGQELLDKFNVLIRSVQEQTLEAFPATTVLVSQALFTKLTKSFSTQNGQSVLKQLKEGNPDVTFEAWTRLNGQGTNGTGERAVAFNNSIQVMEYAHAGPVVKELAPQYSGLMIKTNLKAATAGLILRHEKAVQYLDEAS